MANAQILVRVRSPNDLTPGGQIQAIVEGIARGRGFQPAQWAFNAQPVNIVQDPLYPPPTSRPDDALNGIVSGGPWGPTASLPGLPVLANGTPADPFIPRAGRREFINVYRQILLNGPSDPELARAIAQALLPLAGGAPSRIVVSAMTNPAHRISWDRDIPQAIAFSAGGSSPPQSYGLLFGIFALAGLAFVAARGSATKSAFGRLSTNREGLTFEEWRRAAGVSASTKGIHVAWVKGEDPSDWRAATVASRTRLSSWR